MAGLTGGKYYQDNGKHKTVYSFSNQRINDKEQQNTSIRGDQSRRVQNL